MAAVVGSSSYPPVSGDQHMTNLSADSLPLIDLRLLSQSEVLSLSICSSSFSSVHNLHNDTDVSTPRIDRSVFNESAGSRKQTFSRLRLARRGSSHRSSPSAATPFRRPSAELPLDEESLQIVSGLKSLFGVVDSGSVQSGGADNLALAAGGQHDGILALPSNRTGGLQVDRTSIASSINRRDIKQPVVVLAVAAEPIPNPKKRKRGRPSKTDNNLYGNRSKVNDVVSHAENMIVLVPDGAEIIRLEEKTGMVNVLENAIELAADATPSPKKRKRGRPRKADTKLYGNCSNVKDESHTKNRDVLVSDGAEKTRHNKKTGMVNLNDCAIGLAVDPISSPKKRKRGRPRKADTELYGHCSKVNGIASHVENRIVLVPDGAENTRYEDEKGMATVNENAIDLAAVAMIDDPYGDRLRKNTAGMRTKEEVLDFLQGIQGEWVSSRRKRKIVDANVFGDVLPSGWQLMIRVTRRAENFWLDCARYISPSGQQFLSFKEAASYLHSASGLQDATLSNCGAVDGNVRVTSLNSAENMYKDDTKGSEHPSTWSVSPMLPIEHKEDTCALEMGSLDDFQVEKSYKCHKCRMAFNQEDELLEHLVTFHHRTPNRIRYGTPMNEEAIIKDGKYECQLCRKTFDERHRFYGHFGNHIKDHLKRTEASLAKGTFQKGVVSPLSSVASPLPTSNISAIPARDCVVNYNHMQDQVSRTCPDEVKRRNEVVHTVNSPSFGANSILLVNRNNAICESSNGAELCKGAADDINCLVGQEIFSQDNAFATSAGHHSLDKCNTSTTMKKDELNRSPVSSSLVIDNEKIISGQHDEDRNISSTNVEGTETKGADPAEVEVSFAGRVVGCRLEEDVTANIQEQTVGCLGTASFVSDEKHGFVDSPDRIVTPTVVGSAEAKGCKEDSCLTQDRITLGLTNGEKNLPGGMEIQPSTDVEKSRFSYLTLDRHSGNSFPFEETVSNGQNGRYGSHLVKPSNDQMFSVVGDIKENPRSNICRLPEGKAADDDCQLALSSSEHFSGFKTDAVKISRGGDPLKYDKAVFPERKYFGFGNAQPSVYIGNVEVERSSASLSHPSSANGQSYASECHSGYYSMQAHGDANQVNQNSSITVDSRHDDANSPFEGAQDISYGYACFRQNNVTARNSEETFPAVLMGHNRRAMDDDPRPNDGSMENLRPFPFGNQVGSFENDLNRAFPHREDLGNSRREGTEFGFNGDAQTNGNAATMEFMWKTDEVSDLLGGFADTSSQPVLSSNSLPPYDLMPRKGGNDLFGFKFGDGVSGSPGLRLGNMNNTGYNFLDSQMTTHSEDPKITSYANWVGKEALPLLPKKGNGHDFPIACISCRKMFHCRAPDSRSGSGSDSFLCAVCNAKFPGRLSLR